MILMLDNKSYLQSDYVYIFTVLLKSNVDPKSSFFTYIFSLEDPKS
ncbi:hypothetical protein B0O79_1812 [Flavobacteriaceae bacterium MAR_2009_75]|nr:hypothetical protein B0O79_1812 [Flavobacteriaceae bacterium MAR_2009_75]